MFLNKSINANTGAQITHIIRIGKAKSTQYFKCEKLKHSS